MSGECNVCGQTGHVEIEHCAFKDLVDELKKENKELHSQIEKYRLLLDNLGEVK